MPSNRTEPNTSWTNIPPLQGTSVSLAQLMSMQAFEKALSLGTMTQNIGITPSGLEDGHSTDFDRIRDWQQGDQLRHIDPRATLRTGSMKVRSFLPEKNRITSVFLDCSPSMQLGFQVANKQVSAAQFMAILAWCSLIQDQPFGCYPFCTHAARLTKLSPASSASGLKQTFAAAIQLMQTSFSDEQADKARAYGHGAALIIHHIRQAVQNGENVIVISDLVGFTSHDLTLINSLQRSGWIRLIIVLTGAELGQQNHSLPVATPASTSSRLSLANNPAVQWFQTNAKWKQTIQRQINALSLPKLVATAGEPISMRPWFS